MPREDRNENYRFEAWTSGVDGSDPVLWREAEGSIGSFYFMRSAGYILLGRGARHGDPWRPTIELVREGGEVEVEWDVDDREDICEGCRILSTLPSPDGLRIAIQYWAAPWMKPQVRALEIFDTEGTSLWGPFLFDEEVGTPFWTANGEYLTRGHDGIAWRWREGVDELDVVPLPECRPPVSPPTTSSSIARDGRKVVGTREPDERPFDIGECGELSTPLEDCYVLVPFGCP